MFYILGPVSAIGPASVLNKEGEDDSMGPLFR